MLRDQLFKGSKTRSVFCFFLKRQLLPLEMDYAAGWFCLSLCMQPGSLRLSFAKRRTIWVILWQSWSSIWWAIFHCPLKRQWPQDPEWLNNLNEHLLSGLLWVICFCEAIPAWCGCSSPECFLVMSDLGRVDKVRSISNYLSEGITSILL